MFDEDAGDGGRWQVALIAHDAKKRDLVSFVVRHRQEMRSWYLVATNATA